MQTDTIKLVFTFATVAVVVIGGGLMLYSTQDQNLQLVLAGFIGAALQWVFSAESATRATRAAQTSAAAGAASVTDAR
jgi:hypothetical protein